MERVKTGLETLAEQSYKPLAGLKVGLVTNPTGILPSRKTNIEALWKAPEVHLQALFGPEHGVRGDVPAGKYVASTTDPRTGVPVYSLYGKTRVPTAAMLRGLDLILFDIQDIGARSYTYLSTLGSVLEGAAQHGVPVMVLDRPNPVGLQRVEGGPTQPGFTSFIGKYPTAYLHGMTLGELAKMIVGEGWLPGTKTCELTVVPCAHLRRDQATWDAMGGLPWVPTSPNVPRPLTAHFYAATGIVGELSALSIGIGTNLQFELAGAPFLKADAFTGELERRRLPGIAFQPASWTPTRGVYQGQRCLGVRVRLTEPATAELTRLNFELMDALRKVAPETAVFEGKGQSRMFDLACGTAQVRQTYLDGGSAERLWERFNQGKDAFTAQRARYLLYT